MATPRSKTTQAAAAEADGGTTPSPSPAGSQEPSPTTAQDVIVRADPEPQGGPGNRSDGDGDGPENTRHPVAYLARNARALLKSTDTVVVGALSGAGRKTFSVEEAKPLIKEYLERPVDLDGNIPETETVAPDGDQE